MNGLIPFVRTIEQTTEAMPSSPKTIAAAVMTTNRITSLRELLPRGVLPEKLGGGVRAASQTLTLFTIFMTVAAGTGGLNIIHEGLLMMVSSMMTKK